MPKKCYGVNVSYALDCHDKATVCRNNRIDMGASDKRIEMIIGKAVPWIGSHIRRTGGVDTGAGPFCFEKSCPTPRRDLQVDTVSLRRGMSKAEANKLAKAVRAIGAQADIRLDKCRLSPIE